MSLKYSGVEMVIPTLPCESIPGRFAMCGVLT